MCMLVNAASSAQHEPAGTNIAVILAIIRMMHIHRCSRRSSPLCGCQAACEAEVLHCVHFDEVFLLHTCLRDALFVAALPSKVSEILTKHMGTSH